MDEDEEERCWICGDPLPTASTVTLIKGPKGVVPICERCYQLHKALEDMEP